MRRALTLVLAALAWLGLVPQAGHAMPEGISRQWAAYWTVPTGSGTADVFRFVATRYADGNDELYGWHAEGSTCQTISFDFEVAGVVASRDYEACDNLEYVEVLTHFGPSSFFTALDPVTERVVGIADGVPFDVTFGPGAAISEGGLGSSLSCDFGPGAGFAPPPVPADASGSVFDAPLGDRYYAWTAAWIQVCLPELP